MVGASSQRGADNLLRSVRLGGVGIVKRPLVSQLRTHASEYLAHLLDLAADNWQVDNLQRAGVDSIRSRALVSTDEQPCQVQPLQVEVAVTRVQIIVEMITVRNRVVRFPPDHRSTHNTPFLYA